MSQGTYLDVSLIRQAATELDDRGSAGLGPTLLGGPLRIVLERTLDFEASQDTLGSLIPLRPW